MIGGTATAQNVLLSSRRRRSARRGRRRRRSTSPTSPAPTASRPAWCLAGREPEHFAKITFIHKPDGSDWFEYVLTTNGNTVRLPNTGAVNNLPDEIYLRVVSDGESTITPQYSVDGEDWLPIGEPITELGDRTSESA